MLSSAHPAIHSSSRRAEVALSRQSASCASPRSTPHPRAPGALGGGAQGSPDPRWTVGAMQQAIAVLHDVVPVPRHRRPTTQKRRGLVGPCIQVTPRPWCVRRGRSRIASDGAPQEARNWTQLPSAKWRNGDRRTSAGSTAFASQRLLSDLRVSWHGIGQPDEVALIIKAVPEAAAAGDLVLPTASAARRSRSGCRDFPSAGAGARSADGDRR